LGIFGRDDHPPENRMTQPSPQTATKTPSESANLTVIARPTRIEGKLLGSGEVLVDGVFKGTIDGQVKVRVAERGVVEANVHAQTVEVAGTITGDVTAEKRIVLEATAKVDGNITAPRILIHDGATFRGQVNMTEPGPRLGLKTSSARKDPGGQITP
jgi:cytoskeletal protein CcmA (bactofilin family)